MSGSGGAGLPSSGSNRSRTHSHHGRANHKKHTRSRQRRDAPLDYWNNPISPVTLNDISWRVIVERGDKNDYVILDSEITNITWDETSDVLSGSVTWQEFEHTYLPHHAKHEKKHPKHKRNPPPLIPDTGLGGINEGHLFILQFRRGDAGRWREVWRMRAWQPSISSQARAVTMQLSNDMAYLQRSKDHFRFGSSKKSPHGTRLDMIAHEIAKRYHFKLTKLPKMVHRVKHFLVNGSPLEALQKVLLLERNEGSGRRYFMRSQAGGMAILPLRRSPEMMMIGPALIDATIQRSLATNFITSVTVNGSLRSSKKSKKKRHKLSIQVTSPTAMKRFGYIHNQVTAPNNITSVQEAKKFGVRTLHSRFVPTTQIGFVHPGVPGLRRYDAVMIQIPSENVKLLAFCQELHHTITPGDYQTQVVCRFTDPFVDDPIKSLKQCQAARKRKRKTTAQCAKLLRAHKTPKKGRQRRSSTTRRKKR